ncbi:hypothetical protein D3C74_431370 [compost metagenome]
MNEYAAIQRDYNGLRGSSVMGSLRDCSSAIVPAGDASSRLACDDKTVNFRRAVPAALPAPGRFVRLEGVAGAKIHLTNAAVRIVRYAGRPVHLLCFY